MVYSYLLAFGTTHFNLFLLLLYFTPSQFFFKISFSIVRKYLVAFLWSVSKKKKKTHLGIHSFSSTCLVLLFTCLVGFVFFCNYWRKKKEKWKSAEWLWCCEGKKGLGKLFKRGFWRPKSIFLCPWVCVWERVTLF